MKLFRQLFIGSLTIFVMIIAIINFDCYSCFATESAIMEENEALKEELKTRKQEVEEILQFYLPEEGAGRGSLVSAIRYSVLAGGKRLRPILMLECYRLFGGDSDVIRPFAAAMEMIHTHSLVHDDLPAIDNDDLRRGRKTTHAVYGEALGVLAGDALLNLAYETILQAFRYEEEGDRIYRAAAILANKTGFSGMLGGQGLDVENEKNGTMKYDEEELLYIYEHKTAALLEAAMMVGAVLGGATREQISAMEQIGNRIGLAFQIRDDILDVTSTQEELGKPVFSDARNEKTTFVTLYTVEQAAAIADRLTEEALEKLKELPGETEFLENLFREMAGRKV